MMPVDRVCFGVRSTLVAGADDAGARSPVLAVTPEVAGSSPVNPAIFRITAGPQLATRDFGRPDSAGPRRLRQEARRGGSCASRLHSSPPLATSADAP